VTYEEIDNGGPLVNFTQAFNLVGSRTALATDIDDGGGQDDDFQSGRPEQAVRSMRQCSLAAQTKTRGRDSTSTRALPEPPFGCSGLRG
jgi:hypothetical protein